MTEPKPRRPWRVVLSGPAGHVSETDHTTPGTAYEHLLAALRDPASPATTARVMRWHDGRWGHFETVHADDLPTGEQR